MERQAFGGLSWTRWAARVFDRKAFFFFFGRHAPLARRSVRSLRTAEKKKTMGDANSIARLTNDLDVFGH
jgi:hypothetical protein